VATLITLKSSHAEVPHLTVRALGDGRLQEGCGENKHSGVTGGKVWPHLSHSGQRTLYESLVHPRLRVFYCKGRWMTSSLRDKSQVPQVEHSSGSAVHRHALNGGYYFHNMKHLICLVSEEQLVMPEPAMPTIWGQLR
jgi:hypothetical protein